MALPNAIAGPVMVTFSGWSDTFEPAAASDTYEKHCVATATLSWGTVSKQYAIDVLEAEFVAAADPVGFVDQAIHNVMLQMFADLCAVMTPSVAP